MRRIISLSLILIISPLFLRIAYCDMLNISSPDFEHNKSIPSKFTCQGQDINPVLTISGVPVGAKSLALIVDDPDAPVGIWDHWIVFNIDPKIKLIQENSIPGIQGYNSFGRNNYGGPCPPSGTHRYFFKLFALDAVLNIAEGSSKEKLIKAMQGHVLDQAEVIGLYKKK